MVNAADHAAADFTDLTRDLEITDTRQHHAQELSGIEVFTGEYS